MRRLVTVVVSCLLSGCVAVWGSPYHVESEDSSGGAIRYDHVIISERAVRVHANDMCAKYQKVAVVDNERFGVVLPGGSIDEISFSCRIPGFNPEATPGLTNVGPYAYSPPQSYPSSPPVSSSSIQGRTEVALSRSGGTLTVPVAINGMPPMGFVVDSGATDVVIPADVVLTLLRTGTLRESDFLGSQTYALADGSTLRSRNFRIRSLKVGDIVLNNVTASLAPAASEPLLGQSFLRHFRSWSIDNSRSVLVLE